MEGINKSKGPPCEEVVQTASTLTEVFAELEIDEKVKRRWKRISESRFIRHRCVRSTGIGIAIFPLKLDSISLSILSCCVVESRKASRSRSF